jgi:hypothetical protein
MASLTQQFAGREDIELKAREYDKLQQMMRDQALARYAADQSRLATIEEIDRGLAQYGQINKPDGLSGMGVE